MENYADMTETELFNIFVYYNENKKLVGYDKSRRALDDIQEECDNRGIDFRPESFKPFWCK